MQYLSHCTAEPTGPLRCDNGYVVIRVPLRLERYRGVHRYSWAQLMARFGIQHCEWENDRSHFYMPKFTTIEAAQRHWEVQGLRGRVPVHDP